MKTTQMNFEKKLLTEKLTKVVRWQTVKSIVFVCLFLLFSSFKAYSHCDSYDGPVILDAVKALEKNDVNLVLKWISTEQENEIIPLFHKTYQLKKGDKEIYKIVEKHFFETLVRLHRETEGAPYTGLKPAGTTKKIVVLSDKAIADKNVDDLLIKLNGHIEKVIKDKYNSVANLLKDKDKSIEMGRQYVKAYVDYTHTLEAIHDIIEHDSKHAAHKH